MASEARGPDNWHPPSGAGEDRWGPGLAPPQLPSIGRATCAENHPRRVRDGRDPDNQAEPYLKLLAGWFATTRTLTTQCGMTILHNATRDRKLIIHQVDSETPTAEASQEQARIRRRSPSKSSWIKNCPKHESDRSICRRAGGKDVKACCNTLLAREPCSRSLSVSPATSQTTLKVISCSGIRKLERPMPGKGITYLAGFSGFQESEDSSSRSYPLSEGEGTYGTATGPSIHMAESFFCLKASRRTGFRTYLGETHLASCL